MRYNKTVNELEQHAIQWWPTHLTKLESELSVIPLLLKTQKEFISLLTLFGDTPEKIFDLIEASSMPANLFVKHLSVLTDFGGEPLQRVNSNFDSLFPLNQNNQREMVFFWNDKEYTYLFKELPTKSHLKNSSLKIDGKNINSEYELSDLYKDVIMLLLFGSNTEDEIVSEEVLAKCEIGNLIGDADELEKYIKQRYIFVSRITSGAQANTLGQVAQKYVQNYFEEQLEGFSIVNNGHVEGVTHNDGRTNTTFDLVVSKNNKSVAIEISFQVTTNSTIERKGGQAEARFKMIEASNNYIAYIIDGSGNFQRRSALSTICDNSHCTVSYAQSDLDLLIKFIKEKLE